MRYAECASRATGAWSRFWFAPGSAANLGFCRMGYVAALLYLLGLRGFGVWAAAPEALWEPVLPFRWLGLGPLSAGALEALGAVLRIALLSAAFGALTRTSCAVAAVLFFYLAGLQQCFGIIYHSTTTVPLVLLTLAVARSGDCWSLDSLLRRLRNRAGATCGISTAEYTWPIQLIRTLSMLVFFAAGVAKLRHSGLDWASSDSLRTILLAEYYEPPPPASDLGLWIAAHPYVCSVGAIGMLSAEMLAPLALVSKRARRVLIPVLFAFVASLPLLFGFPFYGLMAIFVFWIRWDGLWPLPRKRAEGVASAREAPA